MTASSIDGVMREICNAFVRTTRQPSVPEMVASYKELRRLIPEVLRRAGASSVFEARVFEDLCSRSQSGENALKGRLLQGGLFEA